MLRKIFKSRGTVKRRRLKFLSCLSREVMYIWSCARLEKNGSRAAGAFVNGFGISVGGAALSGAALIDCTLAFRFEDLGMFAQPWNEALGLILD